MATVLDKAEPKPVEKTRELKKVRGYVAPTETGTVRTVRPHEKLVEVDVKQEKSAKGAIEEPKASATKIKGTSTIEEAVARIGDLNKSIKEADFSKGTDAICKSVVDLYRGGVNTSKNLRIDQKDGLRKIFDELSGSLTSIGFINKYNLSAQESLAKITDPAYIKTLADKMNVLEKRLEDIGLKSSRLDPFTVAIEDAEGPANRIFISNNPLDFISTHEFSGKITEKNASTMASTHQDEMNDMVWYTANKLDGGNKTAVAVATFEPKSGKFYHHTDVIAAGSNAKGVEKINKVIKDNLKAKQTVEEGRTFADVEVGEIRAMIAEQLTNKLNEIEKEIQSGGDAGMQQIDGMMNPNDIDTYFGDIVQKMIGQMNGSFERLAATKNPRSLAFNSPLHQAASQFRNAHSLAVGAARSAIDEHRNRYNGIRQGYLKR